MTSERTAPRTRMTEHQKARVRFPLLALFTFLFPGLTAGPTAAWVSYAVVAVAYALWTLHLTSRFSADQRLGYLLCLTDAAALLPLLVWINDPAVRGLVVLTYGAGLIVSLIIHRSQVEARRHSLSPAVDGCVAPRTSRLTPEMALERAVRSRLSLFTTDGVRFGVVILRVVRFDEASTYYGADTASRMIAAIGRRGLRHLGPDAQLFPLGHGKVAFLFGIEPLPRRDRALSGDWSEPYDVEGMAMRLGRRTCERLIEGHRAECVVGWASAPVDGLAVDDLLYAAESGTRSTEAFRRVGGSRVAARVVPSAGPLPRRIATPVTEPVRTAVG